MWEANNFWMAFFLTLCAGLATSLGGILAFVGRQNRKCFLSVALGFSAGVMIYVSFIEIFPGAISSLSEHFSGKKAEIMAAIAFFAGMLITALIDKLIPEGNNPHETKELSDQEIALSTENSVQEALEDAASPNKVKLLRTGLLSALAIALHNFPEGFAAFLAALKEPSMGLSLVVAIAIHNIPEGIAVSVPVYYATGSRWKAFWFAALSGLAEPLGAVVGYFLLYSIFGGQYFGLMFAAVAGIMVFISFDQLLPTAEEYGEHHLSIYGLVGGMAFMAISLIIL